MPMRPCRRCNRNRFNRNGFGTILFLGFLSIQICLFRFYLSFLSSSKLPLVNPNIDLPVLVGLVDPDPLDTLIRKTEYPSVRILLNLMENYEPPDDARAYYGPNHGTDGETERIKSSSKDTNPIVSVNRKRERCQRFGYKYDGLDKNPRRIFFGGLIADDSWHPIAVHAAEAYGLYHSVSFIESNATHSKDNAQSRQLRFTPDSNNFKVLSQIFGPSTKVTVDAYVDKLEVRNKNMIIVEDMQRELILQRWKKNGMTGDDIGIVGDADEMFTRDFMLAAQTCDIPQFRRGQDCKTPKLVSKALIFESSPECAVKQNTWHHPDMMIGECIDKIGDSEVHKPGKRMFKGNGRRVKGYGKTPDDYSLMPNTTMFPLWKPLDFRSTAGGFQSSSKQAYTGFHIHNFFTSVKDLRRKYATYGHGTKKAERTGMPLGNVSKDLNFSINCATGRPDANVVRKRTVGGFDAIDGPTPVLFQQLPEYRKARHQDLKDIVLEDEVITREQQRQSALASAPKQM
eukprot:CAMPEP_0194287176 /NCGR_PEP_ID=MMETSP0169-20130528/34156_1 /TAXON_ID=218684 /ORGANISM="Corethron pennatum, Strain L29A3" /LENGTH=512 /DNA_ID=CAMNT_0039033805 /DNA_START=11 /DNA_END=1549 /DNA_ORIENTATION=-